jgi:bleomycin hydrolase
VAGGPPVVYLNVPIDELKRVTMEQIVTHKTPVWMGCDVGKQLNRKLGIWDLQVHQRELLYNVTYGMCKADRLRYRHKWSM